MKFDFNIVSQYFHGNPQSDFSQPKKGSEVTLCLAHRVWAAVMHV